MKELSIIFAICLTIVLGEKVQDFQKYQKIDSKNDSWTSKYPDLKDLMLVKPIELIKKAESIVCDLLQHINNEYSKTFDILDDNGVLIRNNVFKIESFDGIFERCTKEEGDCNKAACVIISIYYCTFTRAYPPWSMCMSKYYPGYNIIREVDTCPLRCYFQSERYLHVGKVPEDHYVSLSRQEREWNERLLVAFKYSYTACKTVNGTCALLLCMYDQYPKLFGPLQTQIVG